MLDYLKLSVSNSSPTKLKSYGRGILAQDYKSEKKYRLDFLTKPNWREFICQKYIECGKQVRD